jgi:hypothetical protein
MLEPQVHAECLEFIRAALADGDAELAQQVAAIVREVCVNGHASREAIWRDLSPGEREQFRSLLAASGSVR